VHGDSQEIVPIFRVYTILEKDKTDPKVVNQPSHDMIKKEIGKFIKQIINVTSVVPKLEGSSAKIVKRSSRSLRKLSSQAKAPSPTTCQKRTKSP